MLEHHGHPTALAIHPPFEYCHVLMRPVTGRCYDPYLFREAYPLVYTTFELAREYIYNELMGPVSIRAMTWLTLVQEEADRRCVFSRRHQAANHVLVDYHRGSRIKLLPLAA